MPCHASVMLHKILRYLNALIEIIELAYAMRFLWCWLKNIKQLYIKNWKISVLYQYQNTKKLQLYLLPTVILYTLHCFNYKKKLPWKLQFFKDHFEILSLSNSFYEAALNNATW